MKIYVEALITLSAFLFALGLNGCGKSNSEQTPPNHGSKEITVRVKELATQSFSETLQLSGSIKAYDDILISPEEGGVVKSWNFEKGRHVTRGATLVVLNDDVAKASYDAALAQYKSSSLTYEKQQKVFSEQAVSEWQLKTTEYGRDAAKAQSDLMLARWERTRIKSPISGILDDRYADIGEMAAPGAPIARVVNITMVKVVINVPERHAASIKPGTSISLTVQAYPGKSFAGKVSYIGATINSDNRTFPIESVISNQGLLLKPEMIAKVKINLSTSKDALLIDEGIVQQVDRNKLVVYVEKNGVAQERVIRLGGRTDNQVEIVSGIKAGERLIVSGYRDVIDGQNVVVAK
ncbi:MAG: efflux RND transporter periplasmic adaptor subunit [Ignavibacteriae bacterium]|nr:efflux RND transporter periplasmic adaptor subunit [Ignavibacteriota bacterium]